jgi:hypothetical protein
MVVVLIAYQDSLMSTLDYHLSPLGFELRYFQDPVEVTAMFDAIECDVILFNAADYPRHWKPLLRVIRGSKTKQEVVFILFGRELISLSEAYKAEHLGVNALIADRMDVPAAIFQIVEILRHYKGVSDKRKFTRYMVEQEDKINIMFTHPRSNLIIYGSVIDFSIEGLKFKPNNSSLTRDIVRGCVIPDCSLRAGKSIVTTNLIVVASSQTMSMKFEFPDNKEHQFFFSYLIKTPSRKMKRRVKRKEN